MTVSPLRNTAPPKTRKGQATRARILEAASRLMFEEGVSGTSLDDVGAAAKVGKSQIYHYFADKSALITEVVATQTTAVLRGQQPDISRLDSWESWQAWRDKLVREQLENQCAGGCPLGSIASELAEVDESARVALVDSFDRWQGAFFDGIVRMQHARLISHDADPAALASAVLAAVQGGLLLGKTRRSTSALEASLDAVLGYLRSLAPAQE